MRFGVNYIPSKNWLYSWLDFDKQSIKEDLQVLKALGFDHIRAHILWSYFQPNEKKVSAYCLNNLKQFVEVCDEVGIDFFLSAFTGWMSGFVFFPSWLNIGGFDCWKLNMFTDQRAIDAEILLLEELAKVVNKSERFLGFDLGNELNVLLRPEIDKNLTVEKGDLWCKTIFETCERVAPGKFHCNGMGHGPWFGEGDFSRKNLANNGFATQFHGWVPFTGTNERFGWNDERTYSLPLYMTELSKAYTEDVENRLFQLQEFGVADDWVKEEDVLEKYIYNTLDCCAREKNVWGITWWCSHDISDEFEGFMKMEHHLGLVDINNKPKAGGRIFKKYIEEFKNRKIEHYKPTKALIVKKGTGHENDRTNADRYAAQVEKGIYPAFVLPEKANDLEYLKSRGIEEIIID